MKKILTLALTVSALTIASMTLFASDNTTTPTPVAPITQTATPSSDDFVCRQGLSPEECAQSKENCNGLRNGQGNGQGQGKGNGRGCCRN